MKTWIGPTSLQCPVRAHETRPLGALFGVRLVLDQPEMNNVNAIYEKAL
jgi:hypothetical protein